MELVGSYFSVDQWGGGESEVCLVGARLTTPRLNTFCV